MNVVFIFWSAFLMLSLAITGLAIRFLVEQSVPLSQSLVVRGFVCFVFVIIWAIYRRMSLVPKSIKTQIFRAIIAGLALTFFSMSYNWLSASTVAVLSNIDIPMLVILGSWVGQRSSTRAKFLSLLSIVILTVYTLSLQRQSHWLLGISVLGLGTFLLCFGYFFIKKSMTEENEAITVLTPSLAIIGYGLIQMVMEINSNGITLQHWNGTSALAVIISGVGMFGAYYATMRLYDLVDLTTAEFPTLLTSVFIQPMEFFVFHEPVSFIHLWLSIFFVGVVYLILRSEAVKL